MVYVVAVIQVRRRVKLARRELENYLQTVGSVGDSKMLAVRLLNYVNWYQHIRRKKNYRKMKF